MAEESTTGEVIFKVKTSAEGLHTITLAENKTVLELKTLLAGDDYEKIPAARQRLIYSGRVMKDADALSVYKIKEGNTIHMVKSAPSNPAQTTASASNTAGAPAGIPRNMAAGTNNDPLAGLTGARYAGHMGLPGAEMFGADGGMGAGANPDQLSSMLDDPNMAQMMNEALNNPQMVDMLINNVPHLRNNPQARAMIQSPEFRELLTNPQAMRQAAQMQRMMQGMGGGGANSFPAPGVTDTTPGGANATGNAPPTNPFADMMGGAGGNPFATMFPSGQTPAQTPPAPGSAGQTSPPAGEPANPFAGLFGGGAPGAGAGANPFLAGMPPMTPEQMQQAMQMLQGYGGGAGAGGLGNLFGGGAGAGASSSPPPPADTRPPEERYEAELRQLNDMGFFDFDANVAALRRAGGSVQGAIEQLLR
ncbi:hypothetical protein BJ878DRAFT_518560 [Calycina marina]|uniref:Uncharacterized protein n=1 Tax=Calycina marina TaxID=1763456 RepID=A0A9P7YZ04_9HELO|nr:hypothetical protein BJ878DRAFT_518560 [Calycina marina]